MKDTATKDPAPAPTVRVGESEAAAGYANWRGNLQNAGSVPHWSALPQAQRDALISVAAYVLTVK